MINFLERAKEIENEIIANRRYLHENAELGNNLPITKKYVIDKLSDMGYDPKEICKGGITATVGGKNGGKVILLRADMDALPMSEESGLPFTSKTNCAHTCGHDTHTAMLLGAAKMLKEKENELEGTIKFMFQPDEESLTGAKAMLDAGILENPKVDGAMAIHIMSLAKSGTINYGVGAMASSSDVFKITIIGRGGHGAMPNITIDPINVGAHLHLALQELISRESDPSETAILTFGSFHAGDAPNIIPEKAYLQGTLRTYTKKTRELLLKRLKEVSELTAKTFNAEAIVDVFVSTSALICEEKITNSIGSYLADLFGNDIVCKTDMRMGGSEDFAYIADKVPSVFFTLGASFDNDECKYGQHNPKVIFNENALHIGAAAYAHGSFEWLKNNK